MSDLNMSFGELERAYREVQEELTAFCLLNDEKDRRIEELEAANVQLHSEVKLLKDGFESEEDQEYVHNEVTGLHNMADLYRIEKLEKIVDDIAYTAKKRKEKMRELEAALREIAALTSHRNPCCPTNLPKSIARKALGER